MQTRMTDRPRSVRLRRDNCIKNSDAVDPIEAAFQQSESMFRSPRMMDEEASAVEGNVVWHPVKSLWISAMALCAVFLAPFWFSWSAFALFVVTTAITVCLGHSLGMHRLLIHRSYSCPLWLEWLFVYLGTLLGMAGPYGMIRQHDIRDWAQRKSACHPFLSHNSSIYRDGFWQLHCELELEKPPELVIERSIKADRFYQFIDRYWMMQQMPWALLFYAIGGMPWLVWGIAVRITVCVAGHWLVGYLAHNSGERSWHVSDAGVQGYNVPYCGVITMGEAWHNNHHAFPASARLGYGKYQPDPGWMVLSGLHSIGLVWDLKTPELLPERECLVSIQKQEVS